MRRVLALILVFVITMVARGSEEQLKIVPASEVLHNISLGNPLEYDNCIITGDLNLNKLEVKGGIHFNKTIFRDSVYSRSTKFSGIADFSSSTFSGDVKFCDSTFNDDAYFSYATFKKLAFFDNSTFNGDARFCYSTFKEFAFFENSTFNDDADFVYSTFKGYVFFENVTFNGKLGLTGTSYNRLYVRWNNIKKCLFYDDSSYLAIIKNFKDLGYFEDSDNCYFQYRKDRRGQPWPCDYPLEEPARKFIDFLAEWSYGYGTRPANPFIWSLLLILLFGLTWRYLGFNNGRNDGSNRSNLRSSLIALNPFGFSAAVFLSSVWFLGGWFLIGIPEIPDMPERSKCLAKHIFSLERILGAIFTGLFLLAISRTVIRAA